MLKSDHDRVNELFSRVSSGGSSDGGSANAIIEQIVTELQIHSQLEENIFYPAVRTHARDSVTDLIAEFYDEHHEVDTLLEELSGMEPGSQDFQSRFQTLRESVQHHVREEEGELFPHIQQSMSGELDRLGEEMSQQKSQLMQTITTRS